jgi:hypothetical protein
MTPKEKAKQLKERFENALTVKDCQIVAVDEIIKLLVDLSNDNFTHLIEVMYYQEVKQELLNLKNK